MGHKVGSFDLHRGEHWVPVVSQTLVLGSDLAESFVEVAELISQLVDHTVFGLPELDYFFVPLPVHIVELYLQFL